MVAAVPVFAVQAPAPVGGPALVPALDAASAGPATPTSPGSPGAITPTPATEPVQSQVARFAGAVSAPVAGAGVPAVDPPAPTVTMTAPTSAGPVRGVITLTATATPATGQTIDHVDFQVSPAGTNTWTTIDTVTSAPYTSIIDLSNPIAPSGAPLPPGDYDIRAVATDNAGDVGVSAVAHDVVLADQGATFVALTGAPAAVRGTVTVTATAEVSSPNYPDTLVFQYSPAGAGTWSTFATVLVPIGPSGPETNVSKAVLDTTTLPDGPIDIQVVASDSNGDVFVSRPERAVLVDNTAPTSSLTLPAGPLSGVVTLTASAQDAGSGVASVTFQEAPSGSGAWSTIGIDASAPYGLSFDTRALTDGAYDFRVLATDAVGNQAPSAIVNGVEVSNPGTVPFGQFAVTNFAVPATNVSLLGEIAGSPQHETWATGFTTAPPASGNGVQLPYTAVSGNSQLVLLRYEDSTGWQIVDVLRNQDGSAYQLLGTQNVTGQMDASGEAWIVVQQGVGGGPAQVALFHKSAGGSSFVLDPTASGALQPLLGGPFMLGAPQLSLGEDAFGAAFGAILYPQQTPQALTVATSGGPVSISAQLTYATLINGTWSLNAAALPPGFVPVPNEQDTLAALSVTGPGTGWGVIASNHSHPLMIARFDATGWHFITTGFDAIDLTGAVGANKPVLSSGAVSIFADAGGLWLSGAYTARLAGGDTQFIARYDFAAGRVVSAWCAPGLAAVSTGCVLPLDANHPAAIPTAVFSTPSGLVAEAAGGATGGFVDVFSYGRWTAVPAPGASSAPGKALFTDASDGWLVLAHSIAEITPQPLPSPLALWPAANQSTLVSVALPPAGAGIATSGALAVGLDGAALHYDAAAGWLVDPTPTQAQHVSLRSVAFNGPVNAVAVGDFGTILDWNGSVWVNDPQSTTLTIDRLNSVAFGSDGQGWAVGAFGTILHWDGSTWTVEQPDAADAGVLITSVTVAGSDVFAIAAGNLIERTASGQWQRVDPSVLPVPTPVAGTLTLVSGLPDGGLVVAGQSTIFVRDGASAPFTYTSQPINGIAVGLAAFRDPASGQVRAFVSVAPPPLGAVSPDSNGFPSGDGELLVLGDSGFVDLSRAPFSVAVGEAVVPDPVLAVAASPDGTAAWAVGGYAGTATAGGLGSTAPVQSRPPNWQSSSIWRYDAGGSQQSGSVTPTTVSIPAVPGQVSFAFFSSPMCSTECSTVLNAQPDVNLAAATAQIASFAGQPGGPLFAMLGGNSVGPIGTTVGGPTAAAAAAAVDLANLHQYLSPLGSVPLFAAYGPNDAVPLGSADPAQAWAAAFAQSPAPFGQGALPAGITAAGTGEPSGSVNRYYAFDATQNGGVLRVIVLDNSRGSLELSSPGQTAWLDAQLAVAQAANLPVVVVASRPLNSSDLGAASDGPVVAAKLAAAGVLGVFTTAGSPTAPQLDRMVMLPGGIPEYEGATLGYQQDQNNGVMWYFVSVDTAAHKLSVQAIPIVQTLALQPLAGLTVTRSSTLDFRAIGRRPEGSIATSIGSSFQSIASYVSIPSGTCTAGGCMSPSYSFTSSDPTIGDFVLPSGPGSLLPLLDPSGNPIPSSQSGLFCAYNAGTTTVSVTSGLLKATQTVTVQPGDIGRPCGTVFRAGVANIVNVGKQRTVSQTPNPAPVTVNVIVPGTASTIQPTLPTITPPAPLPPPAPAAIPTPPPPAPSSPPPVPNFALPASAVPIVLTGVQVPAVVVPPIPPPVTTVPPGGATATGQATARREEKARRHASQSAFTTRPAGVSAVDWFYPAVGLTGVLVVLMAAEGLGRPRQRRAFVEVSGGSDPGRNRRYRRR